MKTISVIIPNYNHAKYLPESLGAILSQSVQPVEVIVVDDASTDRSCDVVQAFQEKHPHVSLIQMEKNSGGPILPISEGLKVARGEYLALCASDDIIQPGFFEQSLKLVSEHPEVGICTGDFSTFEDKRSYERVSLIKRETPCILTPDEIVQISQSSSFYIPSQTSLYRKDLVMKYGAYDLELRSIADFYLNCQIAFRHPVGYIPHLFGAYRVLPTSYGQALRFKIRQREKICTALMKKLKGEDGDFREKMQRSGILAHAGLYMIGYLGIRPWYWKYFWPSFKKRRF